MRAHILLNVCAGLAVAGALVAMGCSSENSPSYGSTDSGTRTGTGVGNGGTGPSVGSDSGGGTGDGGSHTDDGGGDNTSTDAGGGASDDGASTTAPACSATLQDKVTSCTASDPTCLKGCGPDLPAGSSQKQLGAKTCSCTTANVYQCSKCAYENPMPGCYRPSASPPACPGSTIPKGPCTTPCSGDGTGNDVCTLAVDGGKLDGCVCVTGASGPVWACVTTWW